MKICQVVYVEHCCGKMFQARMLEEMDEEFGIGNLVEEEFKQDKTKVCYMIGFLFQMKFEVNDYFFLMPFFKKIY
jgi:hypothetical protein